MEKYLDKDAIYNFIENMIEEMKYCNKFFKAEFNKKLVMKRINEKKFQKADKS